MTILTALLIVALPTPTPYKAELFAPGVISTRDYERDGTFTPDGKTFYFTKRTMWSYFSAICVSHLRGGHWTEPTVASFSGQYVDATPFVSLDGQHLYFASRRPMEGAPAGGYNIWVVDRAGDSWSAPHALPKPINGHGSVFAPVMVRDGSLYFVAGNPPHVMVARRQGDGWAEPTPVGADDEPGSAELSGYVDPDERYLVVTVVGRADALKTAEGIYDRADLYVRSHGANGWSAPRHLPAPINTGAEEGSPFVSPDGRYLYFTSERGVFTEHGTAFSYPELERALHAPGNGLGDIYRIDSRAVGITP